jgi:hypothetical protein
MDKEKIRELCEICLHKEVCKHYAGQNVYECPYYLIKCEHCGKILTPPGIHICNRSQPPAMKEKIRDLLEAAIIEAGNINKDEWPIHNQECQILITQALKLLDEPVCKTCGGNIESGIVNFICSNCGHITKQHKNLIKHWKQECVFCGCNDLKPCPDCQQPPASEFTIKGAIDKICKAKEMIEQDSKGISIGYLDEAICFLMGHITRLDAAEAEKKELQGLVARKHKLLREAKNDKRKNGHAVQRKNKQIKALESTLAKWKKVTRECYRTLIVCRDCHPNTKLSSIKYISGETLKHIKEILGDEFKEIEDGSTKD